jgi:hypothetical protein
MHGEEKAVEEDESKVRGWEPEGKPFAAVIRLFAVVLSPLYRPAQPVNPLFAQTL